MNKYFGKTVLGLLAVILAGIPALRAQSTPATSAVTAPTPSTRGPEASGRGAGGAATEAPVVPVAVLSTEEMQTVSAALKKLLSGDPEPKALLDKYPVWNPLAPAIIPGAVRVDTPEPDAGAAATAGGAPAGNGGRRGGGRRGGGGAGTAPGT